MIFESSLANSFNFQRTFRNDLSWLRRKDLENDKIEAIWIEIFPQKSKSILICFLYRHVDTSSYLSKEFYLLFDDMLTTVNAENKEVILAGDLNCNYSKKFESKNTKEIIKSNGLKQMINQNHKGNNNSY